MVEKPLPTSLSEGNGSFAKATAALALPAMGEEAVKALYGIAYALYQSRHYGEASRAFQLLTAVSPDCYSHWLGFGLALHEEKRYGDAVLAFGYAALIDPWVAAPHLHAAYALFALGDKEKAAAALSNGYLLAGGEKKISDFFRSCCLISYDTLGMEFVRGRKGR